MIHMSKEARKVTSYLATVGVEIELGNDGIFDVEVSCSQFFPNHIVGVIQTCFKGKGLPEKLEKAQEKRWAYFKKPVSSILGGRTAAWQDNPPIIEESWNETWARRVYGIVVTTFLVHDINRAEANSILFDIPPLTGDRDALIAAIHSAKDRRVRSVPYLKAILEREAGRRQAEREEQESSRVKPWEPGDIVIATDALDGWEEAQRRIDVHKAFKKR